MSYTCIACITIDPVMRMDKKNHPQVYFEECKYKIKKMQISRFIGAKLESDSESESDPESKSDTELMAKLKSNSDSDSEWDFEQVKKRIVMWLTLDKSRIKPITNLP